MINKNILQSIEKFKYSNSTNSLLSEKIISINNRIGYLHDCINNNIREIKNCEDNIITFNRFNEIYSSEIKIKEKEIKEIEKENKKNNDNDQGKKELNNIYSKLKRLPIEKIVSYGNPEKPSFFILTKKLTCGNIGREADLGIEMFENMVGKEIGQFIIKITSGGTIKVVNITNRANAEYDLPTIHYGSCCWGTIGNLISKYFSNRDFYAVVDLVIDFITSPSYGGPYCQWDFWLSHLSKPIFGEIIYALDLNSNEQTIVNNLLGEKKNHLVGEDKVVYLNDDDETIVTTVEEFEDLPDDVYSDVIIFTNTNYRDLGDISPDEI